MRRVVAAIAACIVMAMGAAPVFAGSLSCDTTDFTGFFLGPDGASTYAITSQSLTWEDASTLASSAGGRLAVVTSATLNSALYTSLNGDFANGGLPPAPMAWIGMLNATNLSVPCMEGIGTCPTLGSEYSWFNGTSTYSNWAADEPNNYCTNAEVQENPSRQCYGQPWIAMGPNGQWSAEGNHGPTPLLLPGIVEWPQTTLDCVQVATPPVQPVNAPLPNTSQGVNYCANSSKNLLEQCVDTTTGKSDLCPFDQTPCNEVQQPVICPTGSTLNTTRNMCEADAVTTCPNTGAYQSNVDLCYENAYQNCPAGYTFVSADNQCEEPPQCAAGSTYNPTSQQCESNVNYAAVYLPIYGATYLNAVNVPIYYCQTATLGDFFRSSPASGCTLQGYIESPSGGGTCYGYMAYSNATGGYINSLNIGSAGGCTGDCGSTDTVLLGCGLTFDPNPVFDIGTSTVLATNINWGLPLSSVTRPAGYYCMGEDGGTLGPGNDCYKYSCPNGGTLSGTTCSGVSQVNPTCPGGTFSSNGGSGAFCFAPYNPVCNDPAYAVQVPGQPDSCQSAATHVCPAGTTWNGLPVAECQAVPVCSIGTYSSTTHACVNPVCPSGSTCYQPIGNTTLTTSGLPMTYCSPDPCQNNTNGMINTSDTTTGQNDLTNDGQRSANGTCLGQWYLFNGTDMRCRVYDETTMITSVAELIAEIALSVTGVGEAMMASELASSIMTAMDTALESMGMAADAAVNAAYTAMQSAITTLTSTAVNGTISGIVNGNLNGALNSLSAAPMAFGMSVLGSAVQGLASGAWDYMKNFAGISSGTVNPIGQTFSYVDGAGNTMTYTTADVQSAASQTQLMNNLEQSGAMNSATISGTITSGNTTYYMYQMPDGPIDSGKCYLGVMAVDNVTGQASWTLNHVVETANPGATFLGQLQGIASQYATKVAPIVESGLMSNYSVLHCCNDGTDSSIGACNQDEFKEWSLQSNVDKTLGHGACHIVGSYCAQRLLGECLVEKQTSCCFGNQLDRIIQEQGRPLLSTFPAGNVWGTAQSPNCRGLTPTEFQSFDVGSMDLSEYTNDIAKQTEAVNGSAAMGNYLQALGQAVYNEKPK